MTCWSVSRLAAQTAEWTLTTTISWWNRSIGNRIAQTIRAAGLGDSSEQVSLRLLMETFSLPYNSVGQEGTEAGMAQGVVKWFNAEKGIGFIAPDGGGPDVFVYNSAVDVDGYRKLAEGARVEFDAHAGGKDSLALKAVGGAPSTAMMAKVLGVGEARPAVKESRVIHTRRPTLPLANHRAAFLIETFGGAAALARVLGVSSFQPPRWSAGTKPPSPRRNSCWTWITSQRRP